MLKTTDHPNRTELFQVIKARPSQFRNATKSTGSRLFNSESFQLLKFKLCCSSSCGFGDAHTSKFSHYLMSQTGNKLRHKHSGRHTAACGSHYTPQTITTHTLLYTHSGMGIHGMYNSLCCGFRFRVWTR